MGVLFSRLTLNTQLVVEQPMVIEEASLISEPKDDKIKDEIKEEQDHVDLSAAKPYVKRKYVHLDLKGAPPKISYLIQLLPLLKDNGVTGLLIEYEDTFPYEGSIYELSNTKPYTKLMLKEFLSNALQLGFDIIPLVQTFGHMEFVLKLESYRKLRENPMYPNVICPSNEKSLEVIKEMLNQLISFHKEFRVDRIHIGNDEVYHYAECPICSYKAKKSSHGDIVLLLEHMEKIASYVVDSHGLKPLVWHDMLVKVDTDVIRKYNIPSLVEVVVWDYTPKLDLLSADMWEKFKQLFKGKIWMASAFKGATAVNSKVNAPSLHLENHRSWLKTAVKHGSDVSFLGIMLTGWQRFDHFSVMCELLPAGIPSLIYVLSFLKDPNQNTDRLISTVNNILKCEVNHPLEVPSESQLKCNFPGSIIFDSVLELHHLEAAWQKTMNNPHMMGWMTSFHYINMYTNPDHVRLAMEGVSHLFQRYDFLHSLMNAEMIKLYERETLDEWLDQNLYFIREKIQKLELMAERLMAKTSWQRRYFNLSMPWFVARARKALKPMQMHTS